MNKLNFEKKKLKCLARLLYHCQSDSIQQEWIIQLSRISILTVHANFVITDLLFFLTLHRCIQSHDEDNTTQWSSLSITCGYTLCVVGYCIR